ncbi:ABC transporter ATP-binding protein [Saccharopolyspora sp. K220]|uniref:dipeptide ABC transporter ATP-binding protein n=1 Tax=Saccharopolyspora soli TaxID=2926618 RepID=UPI001F582651|nr:ABC transporter ATP-binding protein [Saccharopolyspora soli]MCI2423349.1 ABC transporter ATP-binding protein [Saccharopolyspora soli]
MSTLLEVSGLNVRFPDTGVLAVRDASWQVPAGEVLGLVGESGSGKSATGLAVLGLHGPEAVLSGSIRFNGEELLGAPEARLRELRGSEISMIFQDALDSLNPFRSVGAQVAEAYRLHHPVRKAVAKQRAVEMLDRVGIAEPHRRAKDYPHQFSGGMRQRVMIAAALINEPSLLIADEPTTALDSTVQAQVLELLADLQREMGMAVVLVTHDFGVVQEVCTNIAVMYRGRVVETGNTRQVLQDGRHPYTRALVASVPTMQDEPGGTLPTVREVVTSLVGPIDDEALADPDLRIPEGREYESGLQPDDALTTVVDGALLLSVRDLSVTFPGGLGKPARDAVQGVSFDIAVGESFGLVGESGSGKSTISRVVTGLQAATTGQVRFDGAELSGMSRRSLSRRIQLVFQDPYASLNPDRTIGDAVGAPLTVAADGTPALSRAELRRRVEGLLTEVGLDPELADAYPDQLSGGMRQRAGIARALSVEPALLVADEPVSALDVSVQAQVLNLLVELRRKRGLALLFISHDLTVVRHMCSRIAVLASGSIVEIGDSADVLGTPQSEHTRALLAAAPDLERVG